MLKWVYLTFDKCLFLKGKDLFLKGEDLFTLSLISYLTVNMVNKVLSSSKRGNLLDSSSLGCSVLMITNLIDNFFT